MASKRKCVRQEEENPHIALYAKQGQGVKEESLMPITSEHLKWGKLSKEDKACFNSRLAKLQRKEIAVPKLVSWKLIKKYNLYETLEKLLEVSTEYDDGVFEDFSLELALRINEKQIYKEWSLEFFSTIYFNEEVNLNNILNEKCIWFRLCGDNHVLTLPEFGKLLGLYDDNDLDEEEFVVHFSKLEKEPPKYVGTRIWNEIGDPNSSRPKVTEIHSPMARLSHKMLVNSFVHRGNSQDKVHQPDLLLIEMIMGNRDGQKLKMNVVWTLAVYLSKRATIMSEHGYINGGHYVSKIGKSLGYDIPSELNKITVVKDCEKLDKKSLQGLLDHDRMCLVESIENVVRNQPQPQPQPQRMEEPSGVDSRWGDWHANLPQVERREVWRDMTLMRIGHQMDYCAPILTHLGQQSVPPYSFPMAYAPPSVPPYPYPYTPYPSEYVPYLTSSSAFQGNEGYNVNQEGFMGSRSYEAGTSLGGYGFGALVDYRGDDCDDMDDE